MTIKLFRFVPVLGVFSTFVLSGCFEQPAAGPSAAELEALRKADEAQLAMEETRNAYDWQAAEVERRSLELGSQLQAMESELQLRKDAEMQARLEALREETERLRAEGERARAESERITREVEEIRRATPVVIDRPVERPEWDGLFRERLRPYGNWVSVSGYGDCWDPSVGGRGDWRPYVDGSWGWSDQGWSWVSNEPFGWATYHYGRWVRVAHYGWVWVPGMEWAPAWVAWRSGNSHIGWAPLPPEPAGLSWTGVGRDCDSRYRLQAAQYVFVPVTRFVSPSYQNVFVSQVQVTQIYQQSVNVTQIVSLDSDHSRTRGGHGRIFGQTGGPDRQWIDRECRAEVPSIRPRLADGSMVAGHITRSNREGPGPVGPVEVVRNSPEESVSRDRLRVPSVVGQPLVRPEGAGGDSMVGPRGDFRRGGDRTRESPQVVTGSGVQPQARDLPSIASGAPETISIDLENREGRGFRRDRTIPGEGRSMGDIGQVRSPAGPSVQRPNGGGGRGADGAPRPDGPLVDRLVAPNQSPDAVGDAPAAAEVINPSLMPGRGPLPTREELLSRGEGGRLRTDPNAGVEPPGTGPERHVQPEMTEVVPAVESAAPEQAVSNPSNVPHGAGRGPTRAGRSGSAPNSAVEGTEPNMQRQQAELQKAAEEQEARQQQAMAEAKAAQEETARVVTEDQAKQQEAMALQRRAEEAKRMEAEALAQQQAMEAQRAAEAEAARVAAEAQAKQQAMDAGRQAEEAVRLAAEEEARRQQAIESQRQAEEAVRRASEEEARQQAMAAQQQQAEEAARLAAEEQARQQAMEAERQAEEQMRQQQAMEAQRQAEEAARRAAEEQMRQQQAMEAQRQAEEAARRAAEEQMRRQAEEAQRQAQEAARRAAEEQMRRQAEEAQRQAQEAAQRAAQEAAQHAAEEAARQQGAGGQ